MKGPTSKMYKSWSRKDESWILRGLNPRWIIRLSRGSRTYKERERLSTGFRQRLERVGRIGADTEEKAAFLHEVADADFCYYDPFWN
jgi:hypothetical protein